MTKRYTAVAPLDAENEVEVEFEWTPGTPESGRYSGPPEDYDPGSADEFHIVEIWWPAGTLGAERVRFLPENAAHEGMVDEELTDWLDENWERPDDGPDPDDERDRRRDEELTR